MTLSNNGYDVAKQIAQIWLPALGTLYFTLSGIWGLPATEQVIGTIAAVDTFLGVALHLQSGSYKPETAGKIVVDDTDPNKKIYQFQIECDPEKVIDGNKTITVGVEQGTARPL